MKPASTPDNELQRLVALQELNILDTIEEQAYDDLTLLAAKICETPIALVSLVDTDRQWFKSHFGLPVRETPRDLAFCAHAILGDGLFVVEDSTRDSRFHDNPLVTGDPHVKFYAGAPLILENHLRLGTLCVIDHQPRRFSSAQGQALEALARQVVSQLELRLKVRQLEAASRIKDDFMATVNHELRTPLTSISGALKLLRHTTESNLSSTTTEMIDIAYRNSERLLCIVNDILDIAKLEAGKLTLSQSDIDLREIARQSLELNRLYCEQCRCRIEIQDTGQAMPARGDAQRLLQVTSNLISNAAKFTHPGDDIIISLHSADGLHQLAVTDHGPGIPADRQALVFEKFSQAGGSANNKLAGTGLGLHICRHIIELHGGSIGFESIPEQHTRFYFTLPASAGS